MLRTRKYNANKSRCPSIYQQETLSVPLDALKKKKQSGPYDELELAKLMKYYGFQTRDELLDFLKYEHIQF